jgi:hypothetical protein
MKSNDYTIWSLTVLFAFVGCSKTQTETKVSKPPTNSATPAKTPTPVPEPVRYHLYIPTSKGTLYKRIEENPKLLLTHEARSGPAYKWSLEAGTEAVRRLLKAAPDKFPPNTKITRRLRGGYPTLNFNQAFANPKWWKNKTRGKAALYAIANTAIITKDNIWSTSDDGSLTIHIENKPIKKLGAFDTKTPIYPDEALVQAH